MKMMASFMIGGGLQGETDMKTCTETKSGKTLEHPLIKKDYNPQ